VVIGASWEGGGQADDRSLVRVPGKKETGQGQVSGRSPESLAAAWCLKGHGQPRKLPRHPIARTRTRLRPTWRKRRPVWRQDVHTREPPPTLANRILTKQQDMSSRLVPSLSRTYPNEIPKSRRSEGAGEKEKFRSHPYPLPSFEGEGENEKFRSHSRPLPKALTRHPVKNVDLGRVKPNIDRIVRLQVGKTVVVSIAAGTDDLVAEANVDNDIVPERLGDIDRGRHTPFDRIRRLADRFRTDTKRNLPARRVIENLCANLRWQ
jgi:hypothetical protein